MNGITEPKLSAAGTANGMNGITEPKLSGEGEGEGGSRAAGTYWVSSLKAHLSSL
jgi:hypothetical protein